MCICLQVIMYFTEKVALTVIYYSWLSLQNQSQKNMTGTSIHDEYFNWNQMEWRNEISFLEDGHDQMELLFIIVGTRQQHSTKQHSREFNKLLHKAASQ